MPKIVSLKENLETTFARLYRDVKNINMSLKILQPYSLSIFLTLR